MILVEKIGTKKLKGFRTYEGNMKYICEINNKQFIVNLPESIQTMLPFDVEVNNINYQLMWNSRTHTIFYFQDNAWKTAKISDITKTSSHKLYYEQISFLSQSTKAHQQAYLKVYFPGIKNKTINKTRTQIINSPITGKILKIVNSEGEINKGDTILIIDAMKMENKILAPFKGVLTDNKINEGDLVQSGDELISIKNI
jgi:biotin carboxyl carrier protein